MALPGVAGRSCRFFVARDRFFARRASFNVFCRLSGFLKPSSAPDNSDLSNERICVNAGVAGDSFVESADVTDAKGVSGRVMELALVMVADLGKSGSGCDGGTSSDCNCEGRN